MNTRTGIVLVAVILQLAVLAASWAECAEDNPHPNTLFVTDPANAEWKMSEFVILLGWAEGVNCPDVEAMMSAIAQAGFNSVMWYDSSKLDVANKYGLKLLCQPPAHLVDWPLEHPANWGYYVADEPPPAEYPRMAAKLKTYHQNDPHHPAYVNSTGQSALEFVKAIQPRVLSFTGTYKWWCGITPPITKEWKLVALPAWLRRYRSSVGLR